MSLIVQWYSNSCGIKAACCTALKNARHVAFNDQGQHRELEDPRRWIIHAPPQLKLDYIAEDFWTGDTFSTGDVLLEMETGEAHMDVEARDEEIMVKVTVCPPAVLIR